MAGELDRLIDRGDWAPEDKARLADRLHAILAHLTADDDITTASESQLFAILDEELGS
ncbi:putative polyketide synthase pks17 [Mycobacterium kansasii]|nr:putative polyketide synthase pks17 [Mycobacterium kansasii]